MSNVSFNGTPGTPGAPGAAGGIGGAAPATNTGTDTSNSATAVGGAGGAGGAGNPSAGAGGLGGAATATATTPGSVTAGINATANATGGAGGDAGTPGGGGAGAAGGGGGEASSTATLTTNFTGTGTSDATSTGGAGGSPSGGPGTAGGAGGSANAATTTTANGGTADATSSATGGNSAASIGADGIDGAAAAAVAAATGIASTVMATTVGGDGGATTGAGNTAGNGASLIGSDTISDSAQATATASSGTATAEAFTTGGAGGSGSTGAHGGAGGDASLTNAVVGSSSGPVSLVQNVTGGAGGDSTTTAGAGGIATTTLTQTPTADPLNADVAAMGGAGGNGVTGGAGGAATATVDTTTGGILTGTSGGDVLDQSANAIAGDGGNSSAGAGGAGGDASASDIATASGGMGAFHVVTIAEAGAGGTGTTTGANGTATAIASADTTQSAVSALTPGTAYAQAAGWALAGGGSTMLGSGTATATATTANGLLANSLAETTGGAGTASAAATTSGGLILKLTAASSAPTDGGTFAGASAENGTATAGAFDTSDNSYAAAGGLVKFASLGPNVSAAFNKTGAVIFGTGSLGAVYSVNSTGAQTYTSSISWDVNTASLPVGGALDLGLVTPEDGGRALTSVTFELTEDGQIVVPATTFTSAATANTFFTDDLMNLGAPAAGVGGDLNVTASLSETLSGSSTAHGVDFMLGVVPCFAAGTRIRTARGEVAVQQLHAGDRAVSGFGGTCEIIWIGHRDVDCTRHPEPAEVWPVRVGADAFGPGVPVRDLWLSPDHAVFVENVLIPAKYLVNGTTVVQEATASVTYWHVECAQHDVLLAEGLPVESYLDTGNRAGFVEAGVVSLHADFAIGARDMWEQYGCRPLVEAGPALDAARAHLAARAVAMGFVPEAFERVELDRVGVVRAVVPAGVECAHLVSACRVPDGERRRLGAAIGAISLDGVSPGDAGLDSGFYAVEGGLYRWTDGEGVLKFAPADRPRVLELSVIMLVREAERRTG